MKQRLRNGYYVQARPPAGYKYIKGNGKEIVRDEPIASIVQEALEGFNTGRFGSAGEVRQFLQDQPEFPRPKDGLIHTLACLIAAVGTWVFLKVIMSLSSLTKCSLRTKSYLKAKNVCLTE